MLFPYHTRLFFNEGIKIVYCATGGKKIYFASVKFDARAKRGYQPHEKKKCFSRVAHDFFLLWGQKMDLFAPHGQ